MTWEEEFEELRPLLFSIAYRILGSVTEAEDAVQETWLRYAATSALPRSLKTFLSATVTRISIDVLRSARVKREEYIGPWFPEPLLTDTYDHPERAAELADSVSMAALLLLERLSPLERAVFVLREVFGFDFPEVASAVGRSEVACRQLVSRARRHMQAGRPRFEADQRKHAELAERFFDAFRHGDVDGLRELLAADVAATRDSGVQEGGMRVFGAVKTAQLLAVLGPGFTKIGGVMEPTRGERPARCDPPRPRWQGPQHLDPRHPRRTRPSHPRGVQPRQARAPGPGRGCRCGHARGVPSQ